MTGPSIVPGIDKRVAAALAKIERRLTAIERQLGPVPKFTPGEAEMLFGERTLGYRDADGEQP